MTQPTLLITGARGFTGRHLSEAAVKQDFQVVSLVSDLSDAKSLEEEILTLKPTYVIHLAAISAVTHENEQEIYHVNLLGSLNLLSVLAKLTEKPEKIVLASSANIYGNEQDSPIVESCCPKPVNHYAVSKAAMEQMAKTFTNQLNIVIARPFNYTGIGHDDRFVIPKIIRHFAERVPDLELGNLQVEREFNDVRAVCVAYLELLKLGVNGEAYNICSGNAFSLNEVIECIARITGYMPNISINPLFVRKSEVATLCGSPIKLTNCIGSQLPTFELEETLNWMLTQHEPRESK